MPETRIYSLDMPRDKAAGNTKAVSSLTIHIDSPRYLDQPYIAHRNSRYSLIISKYSKWDMSPNDLVKETFRDALSTSGLFREVRLSHAVPPGFYLLAINLKKFELLDTAEGASGEIEFDAALFSPDGKELFRRTVSNKTKLDDGSFLSLAKVLSRGLGEGVNEVISGISGVMPER